jgi:beta-lactamase class D
MLAFLVVSVFQTPFSHQPREIAPIFKGYKATFVLAEMGGRRRLVFGPDRAKLRFSPCSTFKIVNTLIGLETGVVKDAKSPFKWDGTRYDRSEANMDQTLESAFRQSIVWCYQRIARGVGAKRMQGYLDKIPYGNRDISAGIDQFWLMKSLKLSPLEQLEVVDRLYRDQLPFKKTSQALVRQFMQLEAGQGWEFSGKTGSGIARDGTRLGWFVGSVKQTSKRYVFVACVEGPVGTSGWTARELTRKALEKVGLGPNP